MRKLKSDAELKFQKQELLQDTLQVAQDVIDKLMEKDLDFFPAKDLTGILNTAVKIHFELKDDLKEGDSNENKKSEAELASAYDSKVKDLLRKMNK